MFSSASARPSPADGLFGRADEIRRCSEWWESGEPVLVLTGPPGVGKTRLAHELGRQLRAQEIRVAWIELAEARDSKALIAELAAGLDLSTGAGTTEQLFDAVIERVKQLGRAALVLDNFEQLLPAGADVVARLREAASEVRVIVTSRRRTSVPGERMIVVEPLGLDDRDVGSNAGVEMLVDRIGRVRPGFELSETTRGTALALVRSLDGLPLAIELAAARARVLGLDDLAERMSARFELLKAPRAHGGGLAAAIDASWSLLDDSARRALVQCTVFRGSFDAAAAAAVLDDSAANVIDLLQELADSSLLQTSHTPDGRVRLHFLQSIREYTVAAAEPFGADLALARQRHASYFVARAEALVADGSVAALAKLADERDNLLEAAGCALDSGDAGAIELAGRALDALMLASAAHWPIDARIDWFARLVDAATAHALPRWSAIAYGHRGTCLRILGRHADALADIDRAVRGARELGAADLEGRMLRQLGALEIDLDRPTERRTATLNASVEAYLRASQTPALRHELAYALATLGQAFEASGDPQEALRCYSEGLRVVQSTGAAAEAWLLGCLAVFHGDAGRLEESAECFDRSLRLYGDVPHPHQAIIRMHFGTVLLALGHFEQARAELERSAAAATRSGYRRFEGNARCLLGLAARALAEREAAARELREGLRLLRDSGSHGTLREQYFATALATVSAEALVPRHEIENDVEAELRPAIALEELLLELVRGVRASDPSEIERIRAARTRISGRPDARPVAEERISAAALARLLADAPPEVGALVVHRDGDWFQCPGEDRIDCRQRPVLRRLLAAFAERGEQAEPQLLSFDDLVSAGWPGERSSETSHRNRVHVALSTLRRMGLRDWLIADPNGWSLRRPVRVEARRSERAPRGD